MILRFSYEINLQGVEVDSTGTVALVRATSTTFSNPISSTSSGEVLLMASASLGSQPDVTLIQHGGGHPYHTLMISEHDDILGYAVSTDSAVMISDTGIVRSITGLEGGIHLQDKILGWYLRTQVYFESSMMTHQP